MNRRPFLGVVVIAMGLLMASAVPAFAASQQPTGETLFVFEGDQAYPANTAFNIRGGFNELRGTHAWGKFEYVLEMDGTAVKPSFRINDSLPDGTIITLWWFNFPDGLTGVHTFVGHYYAPCQDGTLNPCSGLRPNSVVDIGSFPATITFTP